MFLKIRVIDGKKVVLILINSHLFLTYPRNSPGGRNSTFSSSSKIYWKPDTNETSSNIINLPAIRFIWRPQEELSSGRHKRRVIRRPPEELSSYRQSGRVIWRPQKELYCIRQKSYLAANRREELSGGP